MLAANQVKSRKTEVLSISVLGMPLQERFFLLQLIIVSRRSILVYYKGLQILFLYLDKIVLRLCFILCLILQFLAKYLGNLNQANLNTLQ